MRDVMRDVLATAAAVAAGSIEFHPVKCGYTLS
jgi:hypothetical protein